MNGVGNKNLKRVNRTQIGNIRKMQKVSAQQFVYETMPEEELLLSDFEIKTECDSADETEKVNPYFQVIENVGVVNNADSIMQELISLRKTVEEIKQCCLQLNATVNNLLKKDETHSDETVTFPAKTKEELEDLDKKIGEEPQRYIVIFKKMLIGHGGRVEKLLKNIISTQVALSFNFDGTHGMLPFKSFQNINSCLFNAVKEELPSTFLYKRAIQNGFRRMKNLHFKRLSTGRKLEDEVIIFGSHVTKTPE